MKCGSFILLTLTSHTSPTGKPAFMASVGADKLLKVWDLAPYIDPATGTAGTVPLRVTAAVVAHDKDVNSVAVAPNDSLVATGSQDKTAKVWCGVNREIG